MEKLKLTKLSEKAIDNKSAAKICGGTAAAEACGGCKSACAELSNRVKRQTRRNSVHRRR